MEQAHINTQPGDTRSFRPLSLNYACAIKATRKLQTASGASIRSCCCCCRSARTTGERSYFSKRSANYPPFRTIHLLCNCTKMRADFTTTPTCTSVCCCHFMTWAWALILDTQRLQVQPSDRSRRESGTELCVSKLQAAWLRRWRWRWWRKTNGGVIVLIETWVG